MGADPSPRSRLRHTVYQRPILILLECILVLLFYYLSCEFSKLTKNDEEEVYSLHIFCAQGKSIQTTVAVCKLDIIYDRVTAKLQKLQEQLFCSTFCKSTVFLITLRYSIILLIQKSSRSSSDIGCIFFCSVKSFNGNILIIDNFVLNSKRLDLMQSMSISLHQKQRFALSRTKIYLKNLFACNIHFPRNLIRH